MIEESEIDDPSCPFVSVQKSGKIGRQDKAKRQSEGIASTQENAKKEYLRQFM